MFDSGLKFDLNTDTIVTRVQQRIHLLSNFYYLLISITLYSSLLIHLTLFLLAMIEVMSLSDGTHQTPTAIDYFGSLMEKANIKLQKVIFVVKMLCKQNLADDVGGCIVKQQVRIHWFPWQIKERV